MSSRDRQMAEGGTILVINCGSSSIKFALFSDDKGLRWRGAGSFDRIGLATGHFRFVDEAGRPVRDEALPISDHKAALEVLLAALEQGDHPVRLSAVGHRVVHGGAECDCPLPANAALEARLRRLTPLAPLHLPHNLAGMEAVRKARPRLPQFACFDTAFHHSLPRIARMTGLPRQFWDEGIRRYGFHGLSYEYVLEDVRKHDGIAAAKERIIVAHLGSGASMAAIADGRSVDTTMGFSTLAGLPMGTRCGDLDPGILLYLLTKGIKVDQLQYLLYRESGLKGISGLSRNMSDLLAHADVPDVSDAIAYFCYQARSHLAALTATMSGLDRLIFTGGIGANAPEIRGRIGAGLSYLGIEIDEQRNSSGARTISPDGAAVTVQAFATDEETMIARHVQRLLTRQSAVHEASAHGS